jgi:hypothetical protein
MERFIELIEKSREILNGDRIVFWEENKKNFKKNIKKIMEFHTVPEKWRLYLVASNFLFDKEIFPFDYDSWSSTNLIAATNKQGFEVMMFLNKARLQFLSLPALLPIIEHELVHVNQAAKNPKKYLKSIIKDSLSKELEIEAEKKANYISDEFRKQWVLESVVYCYDLDGWELAKKMADFLYVQMENMYGGGYDKGMVKAEYDRFLEAKEKKSITYFIEFFKIEKKIEETKKDIKEEIKETKEVKKEESKEK